MAIPVTAAAVRYVLEDGSPESEVCWVGNDVFLPHVWKVLGGPNFSVEIQFGEPRVYSHRREATDATYEEIEGMRSHATLLVP